MGEIEEFGMRRVMGHSPRAKMLLDEVARLRGFLRREWGPHSCPSPWPGGRTALGRWELG